MNMSIIQQYTYVKVINRNQFSSLRMVTWNEQVSVDLRINGGVFSKNEVADLLYNFFY